MESHTCEGIQAYMQRPTGNKLVGKKMHRMGEFEKKKKRNGVS